MNINLVNLVMRCGGLVLLLFGPLLFFVLAPSTQKPATWGVVENERGPVAGAVVGFQGEPRRVLSGIHGEFQLPAPKPRRIVATRSGYRIAFQSARVNPVRLFLRPLPADDNDDYLWIDPAPDPRRPQQCGNCHGDIHRAWAGSAHARSATNARFLELYGGSAKTWNLQEEHPQGAGVCASCHAPTLRSPELDYDMRQAAGVSARGVHCDYCHKVIEAPLDKLGTRFGRDGMVLLRPRLDDQLFFGPLDDAVRPGESFAHVPVYKDSAYCASCHEGVLFGVHVYGTYSEWRDSPAATKGQQCQHCHMATTGTMTNLAPGKGGIERDPWTLASHDFPGATPHLLGRCLRVDVHTEVGGQNIQSGVVTPHSKNTGVAVEVRADDVGHRVPTGFIDRHLLLVVEAFDRDEQPVERLQGPALGGWAGTDYRGLAGWLYAKKLEDETGKGPLPFWRAHDKMVDTRLIPGQVDRRQFVFGGGVDKVRVRLLYRRFWPEVAEPRGWNDNEIVVVDRTISPRR